LLMYLCFLSLASTLDSTCSVPEVAAPAPPSPRHVSQHSLDLQRLEGSAGAIARATTRMNRQGRVRLIHSGPASVVGSLDFVLGRRRSFFALATRDSVILELSREAQERMARNNPHANALLQEIMLKSSLTATAQALTALERAIS
jgi:CRP-like cAMP-binding protein